MSLTIANITFQHPTKIYFFETFLKQSRTQSRHEYCKQFKKYSTKMKLSNWKIFENGFFRNTTTHAIHNNHALNITLRHVNTKLYCLHNTIQPLVSTLSRQISQIRLTFSPRMFFLIFFNFFLGDRRPTTRQHRWLDYRNWTRGGQRSYYYLYWIVWFGLKTTGNWFLNTHLWWSLNQNSAKNSDSAILRRDHHCG